MTKRYIALFVVMVVATGLLVGHATGVQFTSTVPGSANDPLVTKGYVDQKWQEYEQKIKTILENGTTGNAGAGVAELIVVELFPNDILKAGAGTEIIVRTGKTVIVAGENGIPDVTAGVDLPAGKAVPLNHQLIVPRSDGRGIKAASSTEAVYVMIRGSYEIVRAQ